MYHLLHICQWPWNTSSASSQKEIGMQILLAYVTWFFLHPVLVNTGCLSTRFLEDRHSKRVIFGTLSHPRCWSSTMGKYAQDHLVAQSPWTSDTIVRSLRLMCKDWCFSVKPSPIKTPRLSNLRCLLRSKSRAYLKIHSQSPHVVDKVWTWPIVISIPQTNYFMLAAFSSLR